MIKGINHMGIVVKDIDDTLSFLKEAFGAEEVRRTEYPMMKQISCIVRIGDGCFELMEPTEPDGPAGKFLETKGGGLHHVSILCGDLKETCDELESQGVQLIGKMLEGDLKIAFVHPKSAKGILYELTENSSMEGE
ncbi:VOC family protein [Thermodesulfobacteriota bacterium]